MRCQGSELAGESDLCPLLLLLLPICHVHKHEQCELSTSTAGQGPGGRSRQSVSASLKDLPQGSSAPMMEWESICLPALGARNQLTTGRRPEKSRGEHPLRPSAARAPVQSWVSVYPTSTLYQSNFRCFEEGMSKGETNQDT